MALTQRSTIVGVFETRDRAARAVEELERAGFTDEQIGFAAPDGEAEGGTHRGSSPAMNLGAETGSQAHSEFTGALTGIGVGGLLGAAAALLIPGVGPAVVGGVLGSALLGAGAGAAAGGIIGTLQGMDVPEEEARYYDQEFRTGRSLVAVRADGKLAEAFEILRRQGAYGIAGEIESQFGGTGRRA